MQEEKGCGRPLLVRRQLSHFYIGQFTFSQLAGCCCCFPHLTCPMTLPNIFSKIDSSPEAYGILASLIMGWCLPPNLVTLKAPSCTSAVGEAPLSDRWGPLVSVPAELSSCHQLCPWSVRESPTVLGKLHLLSLGALFSTTSNPSERREPQEMFIWKMKGEGLSSVASSGWHAFTDIQLGVTEFLPCFIKGPRVTSAVILKESVPMSCWNLCITVILPGRLQCSKRTD